MSEIVVKIKRLHDGVELPFYATSGSAGMDLRASLEESVVLKPGEIKFIPTGIAISLPSADFGAFIFARSGLACKFGIALANSVGVIDSDYRGEIKCALINLGQADFEINNGDRVAQMVFMPVTQVALQETDNLDETERGVGGFGSTGL
ncbi:MAG: dUTP diphosphatase [Clostridia bacterium]|nr:dUTP diphosphatase [Clostridia bacterium]